MTDQTTEEVHQNLVVMPKIEFRPQFISADLAPQYETSHSACFDLRADIEHAVQLGEVGNNATHTELISLPTGLYLSQTEGKQVALMADTVRLKLRIEEKSSLALQRWDVKAGVVDSDYPKEIRVVLRVPSGTIIKPGAKIAQASWEMVFVALGIETKEVVREGGFGSTGE